MMWGAAIFHGTRIRNLIARRGEEKEPARLMRGLKPKLSISKLSTFGCTVFKRKRDSKLEPKTSEGKFVGYTEGGNGYLVSPDNKEAPDLLDEGLKQLGIRQPDDGHQDDGIKKKKGTSAAVK